MEPDSDNIKTDLHLELLPKPTRKAFDFLSDQEWLKQSDWYLAGGTALALQVGNRESVDLDFFIRNKFFDNTELINYLSLSNHLDVDVNKENTVYAKLFKGKVSFISYPFFVPKADFVFYKNIRIIQPRDISVMKIVAISQRGKKRDFFDLYWCAKNIEGLEEIIRRLPEQYPMVAHDYQHILKSLIYFDDAEVDPEPIIFFDADWKKVKNFFTKEIPLIIKELIDLK